MNRLSHRILQTTVFSLMALLSLLAVPAAAKGPPDMVMVSGPGLAGAIRVTDSAALQWLGDGGLEDFAHPIAGLPTTPIPSPRATDSLQKFPRPSVVPEDAGSGYELTRFFRTTDPAIETIPGFQADDRAIYYSSRSGGPGYVFYAGIFNGSSEYDGKWFPARPQGEQELRRILTQHGVRAGAESPSGGGFPIIGSLSEALPWFVLAGAALLFAGWILRRRRRTRIDAVSRSRSA